MKKVFLKRPRFITALLIVIVVSAFAVGATVAFLTTQTSATSTLSIATLETEIIETFDQEDDQNYIKEVSVQNDSNTDCLIRVRIEVSPEDQIDNILIDDMEFETWQVSIVTDGWVYNKDDGYYYYTSVVPSGETTTNIMNTIYIKDLEKMEDFDIIVYQEAVQTAVYGSDEDYGLESSPIFGDDNEITFADDGYQAVWDAYDIATNYDPE